MVASGPTGAGRWPERYRSFRYAALSTSWSRDPSPAAYWARFDYELADAGASNVLRFSEVVWLPPPPAPPDAARLAALSRVVELLYLVAGVSYYKVAAPPVVDAASLTLEEEARRYLAAVYRGGLGEFAYRNNLPRALAPELLVTAARRPAVPLPAPPGGTPLVPVGGGKDSVVSVELLRDAGFRPTLFAVALGAKPAPRDGKRRDPAVTPNLAIRQVLDAAGLPRLIAQRTLDAGLLGANRRGAYNGHVPVTAINALVAVATAVLHGLGPVVLSNERSASSGNLVWHGQQVNHQWSKSLEAERLLRGALAAHAGPGVTCFSLLRSLSELTIARLFARHDRYDRAFSSCNAVYGVGSAAPVASSWCGHCPKCRFVALIMAPFMSRSRLVAILGRDLLRDRSQLHGFRELVGIAGHKPFECVGELGEARVALRLAAEHPDWKDAEVVRRLSAELPAAAWPSAATVERVLTPGGESFVPPEYQRALHARV